MAQPKTDNDNAKKQSKLILNGDQLLYLEQSLSKYHHDHKSLNQDWQGFLQGFDEADLIDDRPSWAKKPVKAWDDNFDQLLSANDVIVNPTEGMPENANSIKRDGTSEVTGLGNQAAEVATYKFMRLVEGYRQRGHMLAQLDPLGLEQLASPEQHSLTLESVNLTASELGLTLTDAAGVFSGKLIKDMVRQLENTYSHNIGVEFSHITRNEERQWLNNNFESAEFREEFSRDQQHEFFQHVREAEMFEQFLHKKFRGDKRFSIEGGESAILALEMMLQYSSAAEVNEVVIGMAHRGRLNTLTKIMGKPYKAVLSEFKGNKPFPEEVAASGDVKYHSGFSNDRDIKGKSLHLSLMCNPSHLETVNPVVMGKVRSVQDVTGDHQRNHVMGLLIHGDAAFAGQGVVPESLELSELDGYEIGGVMHLIINNQIGFTADVEKARKSRYPTELAKVIQAPIFHVNGDNPEAVVRVVKLACEYRVKFKRDVVINLVCYRKYGHNEGDEPNFTQPLMYQKIKDHPSVTEIYAKIIEQ
ncbi:MAG: thiamine pyrophosphate-dependent enzyme [Pseudomonadota bacterium]